MNFRLPKLSEEIKDKDILKVFNANYSSFAIGWFDILFVWCTETYKKFNDHDKFLILVYIVKKTFDYYSKNFVNLTYDQFYSIQKIEIEKFNIVDISKILHISKETTRRKIQELEKAGIIQKNKKSLLVKKDALSLHNPTLVIDRIINFLSKFSKSCVENNIIDKEFTKEQLRDVTNKNFSYVWKLWYDMFIPSIIEHKNNHDDLETFHIWSSIVINQTYETNKYLSQRKILITNRSEYVKLLTNIDEITGINAMSISNLTGIPRATTIRKLKKLIINKTIFIDNKKLYHLELNSKKKFIDIHLEVNKRISIFTSQMFNLAKFN